MTINYSISIEKLWSHYNLLEFELHLNQNLQKMPNLATFVTIFPMCLETPDFVYIRSASHSLLTSVICKLRGRLYFPTEDPVIDLLSLSTTEKVSKR